MRPRTSLAKKKIVSQNQAQKFPISLPVLKLVPQTVLHPLWNVHVWVSESPSSCSNFLSFRTWAMLLSVSSSGSGNHVPCCTRSGLCCIWCPRCWSLEKHTFQRGTLPPRAGSHPLWGPKPLEGLASPGPTRGPIHAGNRVRGPEYPNAKIPERDLAPSSKGLYQENNFSIPST